MSSKRVKISFHETNEGKITFFSKEEIADTNKRVKEGMKDVVRDYEKKESKSQQNAAKLVLNS